MAFIIECAVCAVLFMGAAQLKPSKMQGFLIMLPSLGLIASAVGFLLRPEINVSIHVSYALIAVSAAFVAWLVFKTVTLYKDKTISARFTRLISVATMSAPLSLFVGVILSFVEIEDDVATLVCLSTAGFGGTSFLIAVNLAMVSLCGYQSTKDSVKTINKLVKDKKLVFVRISAAKDVFLVVCKTIISIVALSFFMFTNALYSAGLGVARYIALKMHTQNSEKQIQSYFRVGGVIFLASACYVIYSIRLFYKSETASFHMVVGIAIACYTFLEFGINIREAFRMRKSNALEIKALRAISLSSTLLCFVLTQTALMSFANEGDSSFANALAGVVFGGAAALIGVYVMVRSKLLRRQTHVQ